MSQRRFDVIIIGSGAGGGTLAYELASTGKSILLLERGDFLPREEQNWSPRALFIEERYKARETWRDKKGRAFHPGIQYFVGGNTKFYAAVLMRFRERDFARLAHEDGISPEWPLSYRDLAPYYQRAEQLYQVRGERGADPTEPPDDVPYAHPPIRHEPRIEHLIEKLTQLGTHPFPLPVGVKLDETPSAAAPCVRCRTCDGYPCKLDAKADADVICVRPALRHSNVTLLTGSLVERLETSASGREVTGVVVRRGETTETYRGDIVVVAAGAINSAVLLLRSANDRHPTGLANGSGVVGRHYMFHTSTALVSISARANPTRFQKTLGLNDFYFGAPDYDYPLGSIQTLGKTSAERIQSQIGPLLPTPLVAWAAHHSLDFWLMTEDLPLPENRVTIGRRGIQITHRKTNVGAHRRLTGKLTQLLGKIEFPNICIGSPIGIDAVGHQCGTVRFGTDPGTSALDINCRAHEVDNLYVVDASFFRSSAAVNPTLTIIANAMRVADHLKARLA